MKDHRYGWETGAVDAFLRGELLDECLLHTMSSGRRIMK